MSTLTAKIRIALFSLAIIFCATASAQTSSNPDILYVPSVNALICEAYSAVGLPVCDVFVTGSEQIVILIKATSSQTHKYNYTVTATMQDGTTRTVTGQINRADDLAGYTATPLALGGVAVSLQTTVQES